MKRPKLRKIVLGTAVAVVLALAVLVTYVELTWRRTFDAPDPGIRASSDPAVIERGRYLAFGPAHCASCHTRPEQAAAVEAGEPVPLAGGNEWRLPLGVVRSPNLTPDPETGIGRYTDAQLAAALRHGVKPNGEAVVPFMEFQNLADEDLTAVISYLRSQPAVRTPSREHDLNFAGRAVKALLIRPASASTPPPVRSPAPGVSLERGEYLVGSVANCAGCHSQRNPIDGSYSGPRLAGGSPMPLDGRPDMVVVPPNLTPDSATGHIVSWSEDAFVARFRAGGTVKGSHMPWGPFGRMRDEDLRSIYRYLMSREPVHNETGPVLQVRE